MIDDTIAAVATPMGEAGIAIIRISGPEAFNIADQVYRGKSRLSEVDSHTINYGYIHDPVTDERVEEVLVSVMRAPRTFTAEDVVEINCHGGIISVKKVLDYVLKSGARLAEPGEFTKRAFLNGRIDLTQAEAVIDLIRSKSDVAFSVALKQVEGALSQKVTAIRQRLIELMAHIEVNIDYPEHDVESMTAKFIKEQCELATEEINYLLRTAEQGSILRDGIVTVIVGRPNVGKSSLLNVLAQQNKAIVTDIPGTTRDIVEEYVTVNGIPLRLLDTAGLRETSDVVEKIGVEKSKDALSQADLILLVLNQHEPLHDDELELIEQVIDKKTIVIINKIDLVPQLDMNYIESKFSHDRIVKMSIKEDEGIEHLHEAISSLFFSGDIDTGDLTYVSNIRHVQLLDLAVRSLAEAIQGVELDIPIDMIQIDVRNAWEQLGEIVGDNASEALLDQIFSQFCLGK